jgi:hypothetical protein
MDQTAEERLYREHCKRMYPWAQLEQHHDVGDHKPDFLLIGLGRRAVDEADAERARLWGSVIVEIDDPSHWRPGKFARDTSNAIFHMMKDRIYTVRIDNRDILKHVELCVERTIEIAAAWAAVVAGDDPNIDLAQVLKTYNAHRTPPQR